MVITALVMGFAGSLHCVGMCSPLAMAVTNLNSRAFLNRAVYNAGRILAYAMIGGIVSTIGYILPVSKFQNLLSIFLGACLLFAGLGRLRINFPILSKAIGHFTLYIKNLFALFIRKNNLGSVFFLGTLNGILPCGLVWIALSYCITLRTPGEGFIFMSLFGAGTLPVMLGLASILPVIIRRLKFSMHFVTSGMLILSGALVIARVFVVNVSHQTSIQQGLIDIVLCR